MNSIVKRALESALCTFGATTRARRRHLDQTLILAYHNIVPDGAPIAGDRSLHLPEQQFAQQLELLSRTHDVIPLSDLGTSAARTRPRAIVTFDDAYRGALTAGVAQLRKRSLPATVFVAPAFSNGKSFWWDVLADSNALDARVRDHALQNLAGDDRAVRAWASTARLEEKTLPDHQTVASEDELRAAAASGLVTFGSHTWSHVNLTRLDAATVQSEMTTPLNWLRDKVGSVVNWISYPYGLSNAVVEAQARECGFDGALLISGGWIRDGVRETTRYAAPRHNVPAGLSLQGFEILAAGVFNAG